MARCLDGLDDLRLSRACGRLEWACRGASAGEVGTVGGQLVLAEQGKMSWVVLIQAISIDDFQFPFRPAWGHAFPNARIRTVD